MNKHMFACSTSCVEKAVDAASGLPAQPARPQHPPQLATSEVGVITSARLQVGRLPWMPAAAGCTDTASLLSSCSATGWAVCTLRAHHDSVHHSPARPPAPRTVGEQRPHAHDGLEGLAQAHGVRL